MDNHMFWCFRRPNTRPGLPSVIRFGNIYIRDNLGLWKCLLTLGRVIASLFSNQCIWKQLLQSLCDQLKVTLKSPCSIHQLKSHRMEKVTTCFAASRAARDCKLITYYYIIDICNVTVHLY